MKQTIDDYILNVLTNLKDKKIIVTCPTSGIGLALARLLVFKEAHVIMAVKNMLKGTLIKQHLLEEFPNAKVDVVYLDQSSFKSIDDFVQNINENYSDYHSLVINAGIYNTAKGLTQENGYPLVSSANLFGPIYLVNQLVATGNRKKHKIIFQGSLSKVFGRCRNFENAFLNSFKSHSYQFNNSKLGLYNVFNYFHNNRKHNYFFYWAEPGVSGAEIIRRNPLKFKKVGQGFMNKFFAKPLESSLPAASICNTDSLPSGISVAPDGMFHIKGLPTIARFNPRLIIPGLAEQCLEDINERK